MSTTVCIFSFHLNIIIIIVSFNKQINYLVKSYKQKCVKFLERQAQRLGFSLKVFYMAPEKPVVIIT